jgi:D-alanine-D-alanine ligase
MKKRNIAVLYGGVSPEHEVAIISALQAMHTIIEAGHQVIPLYVSKLGNWYRGNQKFLSPEFYRNLNSPSKVGKLFTFLPSNPPQLIEKSAFGFKPMKDAIDAIFPIFHGANGEDGSVQGLIQLLNLPIIGCQLVTSAIGIDKYLTKKVVKDLGLPVTKDVLVSHKEWLHNKQVVIKKIRANLGNQVFVKPNTLGSSIGLSKAFDKESLIDGLDVAFAYDHRVLVEEALTGITEINISILGNDPYKVSITEEPISTTDVLSYEDKYVGGGTKGARVPQGMASAKRIMPARVDKKVIKHVEQSAIEVFRSLGGKGLARIDFILDHRQILYFNEINTIPGSLSFYLWEKSGLSFPQLMHTLIKLGIEDFSNRQKLITNFNSNILSQYRQSPKLSG